MKNQKKDTVQRLKGFDSPSIWTIMTPLAIQTQSVNLGPGFPSWQPPSFYLQSLSKSINTGSHQYTRSSGLKTLTNAICKYNSRFKNLNPQTQILVSNGADEALHCAFLGFVDPGDQVILFDPSYNVYRAQIQLAGGKSRGIPLIRKFFPSKEEIKNRRQGPYISTKSDEWEIDFGKLQQILNQKTKIILINTPHNPSGKIFTIEQLQKIAKLLIKYPRVIVIEDNVYERMTFDDYFDKDLPKMSFIQGMQDRTVSIYSAGKMFSATGIRIGWAIGPQNIIKTMMAVHQYNIFCLYEPLQTAIAQSLQIITNNSYMKQYAQKLSRNRNLLIDVLLNSKYDFNLWIPQSGYFIITDISRINVEEKYFIDEKTNQRRTKDMAFCIKMALQDGVVAIPCSSFYDSADIKLGQNMVRFAFCKQPKLILEAGKRLLPPL